MLDIRNTFTPSEITVVIIDIQTTYQTQGTITDTRNIIRTGGKCRHLNSLEKYYIYRISKNNLHINDIYINTYNPTFKA
jgi:hypothetical protein